MATIQDGQLQRTTMTAVPAPPPSAFIDSVGAGEELSASTAVALPLHASTAYWQLRLVCCSIWASCMQTLV